MAIVNRYIQQAAGVDNISLENLNDNHWTAGLYKLTEELVIYRDNTSPDLYYIGEHAGATLYKKYDSCSIIMNSDVFHNPEQPNIYAPTTQILIPYNDTKDSTLNEIFIRYNNESGAWSTLSKVSTGEAIRSVLSEVGYYLVDNTDPVNPVVLSDRSKVDKLTDNFTFTGGSGYKPGDVIPTDDDGINFYVEEVDPYTGEITKGNLTHDDLTGTKGSGSNVHVNTEIKGSIVEFDEYGNLKPSDFKATYVKPYEFTYQDTYFYELNFDEDYDNSDLAGGTSDYGFAYSPFNFTNFIYKLVDKATGEELEGTVDFDYENPMYIPTLNPGSLIFYGYVNSADKVQAVITDAKNYKNGDTFTFNISGNTYNGTIVDTAQAPWVITTDLPVDIGAVINGLCDTITKTGSGTGLKVYVSPAVVEPCYSLGIKDIPDRSLVWSGVKAVTNESISKVGTICIPFQFNFDIKVNGVVEHKVEHGTITVNGIYSIRRSWTSNNYNTITPISETAENWNNGDEFTVSVLGTTYTGQIDDISTEPYTLHTDIPQTTDLQMTGTYTAIAKAPSKGIGLLIKIETVNSYTYKLKNTYVDPHGGQDPAFYANSQVDILLARQRIQAGTVNNVVAFAGQEGKFNELVRKESIEKDVTKRSDYAIPTEAAIGDFVDNKLDNDSIANLTSEWIETGEQLNLNKASGAVASSVLVPYASETQDGLIKKGMYGQIVVDHNTLLSLQGMDFIAAKLGETPSQSDMTKAWQDAGKSGPVVGNKIINVSEGKNQGHNWMYLEMNDVTQWYDIGSGTVNVATNAIQGVVMGTEPASTYDYNSSIVKQTGSANNFINEVLTTTAAGATEFKVEVLNTDSDGNITLYKLTPESGTDRKMLANIPFTKSHTAALYYETSYMLDTTSAQGYVNQEKFKINNITGNYEGYVLNSTVEPILCITNIPAKTQTDISGTYTTTSTTGSGTGLRIIVTSVPYYETVTFRLNITSWENPLDMVEIADYEGHMRASGVGVLAEHTKFLNQTKADREEITLTSNDNTISIKKPEGFESYPRFDLSFNLAASTTWITLTGLLDGVTSEWDITPYLQGISTSDLEFYYGDGILFAGIDYTFKTNIKVLAGGAGYAVNDIIMLNNDTRSAKVESVGSAGEILTATLSTSLPSTTSGTGADLAAQFIFTSLKEPVMNSAKNRTFMVKGTKLSLVSDLSGVSDVVDPTGTINTSVKDNVATIGLNVGNVFRANPAQPCYITLTTPTESQSILSQGSLINLLQSLTNNMKYVMDNAVWKYKNSDTRVEIAVQDAAITPKTNVNIIQVKPSDLGQIVQK